MPAARAAGGVHQMPRTIARRCPPRLTVAFAVLAKAQGNTRRGRRAFFSSGGILSGARQCTRMSTRTARGNSGYTPLCLPAFDILSQGWGDIPARWPHGTWEVYF
jgi:hypothetical protein